MNAGLATAPSRTRFGEGSEEREHDAVPLIGALEVGGVPGAGDFVVDGPYDE